MGLRHEERIQEGYTLWGELEGPRSLRPGSLPSHPQVPERVEPSPHSPECRVPTATEGPGDPRPDSSCRDHEHRGLVAAFMCPLGSPVVGTGGKELGVWHAISAAFFRRLCPPLAHHTQMALVGRGKSTHSSSAITKARVSTCEGGRSPRVARW